MRSEERMEGEMEAERDVMEEKNMVERSEETEVQVERTTEEVCNEDERCEEEASESHSTAKQARLPSVFSDSQEAAIVELIKQHPEL